MKYAIPKEVSRITEELQKAGFEAFLVGGCVRDLALDREPKDWDVTTNATPEKIQEIFPDSFYENAFGTVGVKTDSEDPKLKVIEITPYRKEGKYSDHRHPDDVIFSTKLEDDLQRRDFTINALALSAGGEVVDLFEGKKDLENGLIRTVGSADERFTEDALRILRAVRFMAELDFAIESETMKAIQEKGSTLEHISKERIRDEFTKIINSKNPMIALDLLQRMDLLKYISPLLEEMVGVEQNKEAHKYNVWEHCLRSLQHGADKDYPFEIRLSALLHDIAKPRTKRVAKNGATSFHNHEVVGAQMAYEVLTDLHYSKETIKTVSKLVRWHMFFSDPDEITLSAVRRIITKVGEENIWNLINLRICDRIGTGRPKEEPYRLRKYKSMIDEALRDPLSVQMLAVDGNVLMNECDVKAGPAIGLILHILLDEVLDDPTQNTLEHQKSRVEELKKLPFKELQALGEKGKERLQDEEGKEIKELRKKHQVS